MGFTNDIKSYTANCVRLSFNLSQGQVGGGDLPATLRIDKNNFSLYNIDVVNTVRRDLHGVFARSALQF
jgi:hypothetical protein